MTQDEQRMLSDLADKIARTPPPPRDAEAEEFIRTRIGNRPDALYLMTQTVLIQNMALQQAQQQLRTQGGGGSFLGQAGAPSGSQSYGNPPQGGQFGSAGYGTPAPPPQYAQPLPNSGGAPSFLRGAAQTAAGVAAGALAFEGIQSLFSHPGYGGMEHGFGGGGFGGGFGGGNLGGGPAEETIVNNYYDNSGGGGGGGSDNDLQLQDDRDDFSGGDNFDSGDSGVDDGGGFDDNFS